MNLAAERAAFRALEEHRLFSYISDVMEGDFDSYTSAFDYAIDNSGIESETLLETLASCASYNGRDDYVRFRDETDAHYGSEYGYPDGSLSAEEWKHGSDEDIARFEAWLEREDANDPMRGCKPPERCVAHKDFHTDEECAEEDALERVRVRDKVALQLFDKVEESGGSVKYEHIVRAFALYDEAIQTEGEKL